MTISQSVAARPCACGCGAFANPGYRYCMNHDKRKSSSDYIVDSETGCWLWQRGLKGSRLSERYGVLHVGPGCKQTLAHRFYYERHVGPIPEGLDLHHRCENTVCVNPEHLQPLTHAENIQLGRGTKLTPDDVRAIRRSTAGTSELARKYCCSERTIWAVRAKRKWKNID